MFKYNGIIGCALSVFLLSASFSAMALDSRDSLVWETIDADKGEVVLMDQRSEEILLEIFHPGGFDQEIDTLHMQGEEYLIAKILPYDLGSGSWHVFALINRDDMTVAHLEYADDEPIVVSVDGAIGDVVVSMRNMLGVEYGHPGGGWVLYYPTVVAKNCTGQVGVYGFRYFQEVADMYYAYLSEFIENVSNLIEKGVVEDEGAARDLVSSARSIVGMGSIDVEGGEFVFGC